MWSRRGVAALVVVVCVVGGRGAPAGAAIRNRPDAIPVTNGTVEAVARSADRIYLGGNFTRVLPRLGPFAILSPASGQTTGSAPEVSGGEARVDSVAADGAGGFYVGGSFTHVAGVVRHDAAHILADGSLDPAWNPDVAGEVLAITRLGSTVYLGGAFHGPGAVNGSVDRDYLAAVDGVSGQASGWAPKPDSTVYTLAASGSTVYFGGLFNNVDGTPRQRAAAADATSGALAAWDPKVESGSVAAITVAGTDVWVGGSFLALNGTTTGALAPTNATTGAVRTPWGAVVGGGGAVVWTIAVSGSTIYFGGEFSSIATGEGFKTRHNAGATNPFGLGQSWNPNVQGGKVNSLVVSGSNVYLAGNFSGGAALNGSIERNHLAAVDAATGAVTGWNPDATGTANALAISGGSIGVGGEFSSLGLGVPRHDLAAFSAADGSLLPWAPEPDGPVEALLPDGSQIYVGGKFSSIGGRSRPALAAIDTETAIATGWAPVVNEDILTGMVDTMQLVGSTLYFGGTFDRVNSSVIRNDAAAVDTTTGFATPFDPFVPEMVSAILAQGSTVYLAGPNLSRVGGKAPSGTPRQGVAAVRADTGAVLPWDANLDGGVYALAAIGPNIYLGGTFSTVGGVPRDNAAAVDATTALPTGWDMHLSPLAVVKALAVSGSTVYAGGLRLGLSAVDGTSGAPVGWNPGPNIGGEALALAADPAGGVVAGGTFRSLEEGPQASVASFSALPESLAPPTLSGTPTVGQTLTCGDGTWAGSVPQSHNFAWLRDGAPIGGASAAQYALTGADGDRQLSCRVTAANLAGSATATSTAVKVAPLPGSKGVKPVVSGLKIAPSSFRAAKRGGSIVPKRYATVSYRLSAVAKVTFAVQRPAAGRRHGKSCVKPTPKLRKAKKCKRFLPVPGSFARSRPGAGPDRFHFSGRLGGRTLRPGPYRLTVVAVDDAGARSQPATGAFRILKPKPKHRHAGDRGR